MPYTAAQLTTYYTNVNGIAPDAATAQFFTAYAQQNAAGTLSDAATLAQALASGQTRNGIDVSVETYSYFTGTTPSAAGIAFLDTNTAANPNNLNSAYYAQFNTENRYYNFAINLALTGAGAAAFATNYGSLTPTQYISLAYEQIIGSVNVGSAAAAAALAFLSSPSELANFSALTTSRTGLAASTVAGSQFDLAQKAVIAGFLLEESNKSDVGTYAKAMDQFVAAVAAGTAIYGTNLVTTYSTGGAGFNTGVGNGGTGVANAQVTLLTGGDTITTGSNTTFNGLVGTPNTIAGGTTISAADSLQPSGTGNTLSVTYQSVVNDPVNGALVSGIQTLNARSAGAGAQIFNVSTLPGLTSANSNQSIDAVTFTNLGATAAVGLIGNGATLLGNLSFTYAAATTAPTINISGGVVSTAVAPANSNAPTVSNTAAGATAATINSTGAANALTNIVLATGNTVNTLQVNAATNLTMGPTGSVGITGLSPTATVTVSGAAANVGFGNTAFVAGQTINASGMTAGGVTINLLANDTFTGGAGNDSVTLASGTVLTNTVAGGAGTNTIGFTLGADLSAANPAKISGFTTLQVSDTLAGAPLAQTFDASLISGITVVNVAKSTGGAITVSNLIANPTVNITGTQTNQLNLQLANAGGGTDVLNANVTVGSSLILALGGTVTAGQIETLNLAGVASATFTAASAIGTVTLVDNALAPFTDPNTVKITGATPMGVSTSATALGHDVTIDGSAATASLTLNASASTGNFATNINGGTANDTISVASQSFTTVGQNVYGGGGGDTINLGQNGVLARTANGNVDTVKYAAATDSQLDFSGTTGASGTGTANTGKMDVVNNFVTGVDKIDLTLISAVNGVLGGGFANYSATDTSTNFNSVLATANFFTDSGATVRGIAEIHVGQDTYVIVNTAGGTTYNAADLVIKLAGASTIATSDFLHS